MAGDVASRDWAQAGFADIGDAKAAALRQLYRTFGLAAVRAQARLKLGGLALVGTGAREALGRRSASFSVHARLRQAAACARATRA